MTHIGLENKPDIINHVSRRIPEGEQFFGAHSKEFVWFCRHSVSGVTDNELNFRSPGFSDVSYGPKIV